MLIVLSPAKSLDLESPSTTSKHTIPEFIPRASELIEVLRTYSPAGIAELMDLSDTLSVLNVSRYAHWNEDHSEARQAIMSFNGDVYAGLDARSLSAKQIDYAQQHLRILSGLYGLLRPLDAIQPYRLEMGTRLRTRRGGTLYDFWGDRIARQLKDDAEGQSDPTLVNLASQEYFGAVDARALKLPVITPQFRELRDGESRIISFFAKKARGLMARWAVDNRVERAEDLKGFDLEGYGFDKAASTDVEWIFIRSGNS